MNVREQQITEIVKKYDAAARVKDGPPVPVERADLYILLRIVEQAPRENLFQSEGFKGVSGVKIK